MRQSGALGGEDGALHQVPVACAARVPKWLACIQGGERGEGCGGMPRVAGWLGGGDAQIGPCCLVSGGGGTNLRRRSGLRGLGPFGARQKGTNARVKTRIRAFDGGLRLQEKYPPNRKKGSQFC